MSGKIVSAAEWRGVRERWRAESATNLAAKIAEAVPVGMVSADRRVRLDVPVQPNLRPEAEAAAADMGFVLLSAGPRGVTLSVTQSTVEQWHRTRCPN
ncbi:MAG TPA: hypothetical protein VKD22_05465, partial [Ramlibacter sp.]|nr:hypothetical protein [Ramlibacter sp.]